jgi:hypothetical protein
MDFVPFLTYRIISNFVYRFLLPVQAHTSDRRQPIVRLFSCKATGIIRTLTDKHKANPIDSGEITLSSSWAGDESANNLFNLTGRTSFTPVSIHGIWLTFNFVGKFVTVSECMITLADSQCQENLKVTWTVEASNDARTFVPIAQKVCDMGKENGLAQTVKVTKVLKAEFVRIGLVASAWPGANSISITHIEFFGDFEIVE